MTVIVPERKVRANQSSNPLRLANSPITDGCIFATSGGTLLNSATETRGAFNNNASNQVGQYLSYKTTTGTADRVNFNNTLAKSGQTEYSFACLFKWNGGGSGTNQYLINRHADGTNFIILNLTAAGTTASVTWAAAGSRQVNLNIVANRYYFITASTPPSGSTTANQAAFYLDGVIPSDVALNNSAIYSSTGKNVILGGRTTDNLRNFDGEIALAAIWDRVLRNDEHISLAQNPWQIFAPRRQLLYVSATSVQLSYLRPASDITTGSWSPSTGTTLYGVLDEVAADDADYIQASTATGCEIKLSAGSTPVSRDNHTIKYRLLAGSGNIAVVLKCGSTTIKSWNHTLTGSAQDFSQALSNAEATNITDYSDLRVTFTSS